LIVSQPTWWFSVGDDANGDKVTVQLGEANVRHGIICIKNMRYKERLYDAKKPKTKLSVISCHAKKNLKFILKCQRANRNQQKLNRKAQN